MADTGAISPGAGSDDASIGTVAWINPNNITLADGSNATFSPTGFPVSSHYLKALGFAFTVPTTAAIRGVLVEYRLTFPGTGSFIQNSIKLVKGGTISGTDQSTGGSIASGLSYKSWGGSGNMWGLVLIPSDINSATFGSVFSATQDSDPDRTMQCDHARITVYYQPQGVYSFMIQFLKRLMPESLWEKLFIRKQTRTVKLNPIII